jgi:hypothetical protein
LIKVIYEKSVLGNLFRVLGTLLQTHNGYGFLSFTKIKENIKSEVESLSSILYLWYLGPDWIRQHRVTVEPEHRNIGIGTMSREGTSEADYIWRPATATPFPRPRTYKVGEIGWQVPQRTDWSVPSTGQQIMVKTLYISRLLLLVPYRCNRRGL